MYEQLRGMLIGTADCCMAKNLKHMIVWLHGEKQGYLFLHEIKMLGNVVTFDEFWLCISLSSINVLDMTVVLALLQHNILWTGSVFWMLWYRKHEMMDSLQNTGAQPLTFWSRNFTFKF